MERVTVRVVITSDVRDDLDMYGTCYGIPRYVWEECAGQTFEVFKTKLEYHVNLSVQGDKWCLSVQDDKWCGIMSADPHKPSVVHKLNWPLAGLMLEYMKPSLMKKAEKYLNINYG